MEKLLEKIVKTRCGGAVERCHTIPHHGSYSNAKHSWGVAMLMLQLWPEDFPRLAAHCLTHDIAEGWTGDIPAPVLWACGSIKMSIDILENDLLEDAGCPRMDSLSAEDKQKVKSCDSLELYFWCREQLNFGNKHVLDCLQALESLFGDTPYLHEKAYKLFLEADEYSSYTGGYENSKLLPKQQGIIKQLVDSKIPK